MASATKITRYSPFVISSRTSALPPTSTPPASHRDVLPTRAFTAPRDRTSKPRFLEEKANIYLIYGSIFRYLFSVYWEQPKHLQGGLLQWRG